MPTYDAVIIGSGFGGCIVASKLIEKWATVVPSKRILILERGTWWLTPEKLGVPPPPPPNGKAMIDWLMEKGEPFQYWPRPEHKEGLFYIFAAVRTLLNPRGLYRYFMSDEAHILTASGVGGGSLIYSNVNLQPEPDTYQGWPIALDDQAYQNARDWMAKYRGKISQVVTKAPVSKDLLAKWGVTLKNLKGHEYLYLDRSRALKQAAEAVAQEKGISLPWEPLDLSITEFDGDDDPGGSVKQHTFCERQGRCILGCIPQARHTLNKTIYSKLFQENNKTQVQVDLWSLVEVTSVAPNAAGGYDVFFDNHNDRKDRPKAVSGQRVFFTAGCLGTNEVLLRSHRKNGGALNLGELVGQGFSTNGDFAGFVVGTKDPVHTGRGPINTGHIKYSYSDGPRMRHVTIEDAGIPKMLGAYTKAALDALDNIIQREFFKGRMLMAWDHQLLPDLGNLVPTFPHTTDPQSYQTEDAMLADIFFFNCMGMDDANGKFELDGDGKLRLKWDQPVGDHITFQKTEEMLRMLQGKMGRSYVPFPLWKGFSNKKLIITHPLGGCRIGNDRSEGTVNAKGQLFDASQADPKAVYNGLYVVDASIVPNALAANPTLTITALGLKIMEALA